MSSLMPVLPIPRLTDSASTATLLAVTHLLMEPKPCQDMVSLLKEVPELPGRKMLQDPPTMVAEHKTLIHSAKERFGAIRHDFFTP